MANEIKVKVKDELIFLEYQDLLASFNVSSVEGKRIEKDERTGEYILRIFFDEMPEIALKSHDKNVLRKAFEDISQAEIEYWERDEDFFDDDGESYIEIDDDFFDDDSDDDGWFNKN